MVQTSSVKLSIDLDMKTALRLARFEVETGMGLDQLLVRAVENWERTNPLPVSTPADARVPVYFNYTPRTGTSSGRRTTRGRYDIGRNEVEITEASIPALVGQRGSPSDMAMVTVRAMNPGITAPNRSGLRDWKQTGSGRPIRDLLA